MSDNVGQVIRDLSRQRQRAQAVDSRSRRAPVHAGFIIQPQVYLLACGGGNIVYTYGASNFYGLLSGFNITSLPAVVPPGSPLGTNPSGLTWANIYDSNGNTSLVWMALLANGSSDISGSIVQGAPIVSRRSVQVLVSGSTYGTVYLPFQLG